MEKTNDGARLEKRLGLGAATMAGIGVILGAGIYVLIGIAAGEAGNAVWLSFIFAAVGAGLTGVSYARLGKLRPKDAPEFHYVEMAYGRHLGFLAGWLVLWAAIISVAPVSLGFASYLFHLLGVPILPVAIGLILFSAVVVFLGIGESIIIAGILTVIEVLGLVFIIAIGIPYLGQFDYLEMPQGIGGVIGAASLVFFAYLGFEGMANLSEEMKNPERDLPRAILLALSISTLFYILVSISAVSVLGWNELSLAKAPLAEVAARVLGDKADLMLTLIALSSTANTVLILLLSASRAMWSMSCAGVLPMAFCVIGKNRRTPWLAILLVGFFASLFASIRNIGSVAEFTNFATLLAFAMVNASALKLFGAGNRTSGFRGILTGIIMPVSGTIICLWLAANTGWQAALLGTGLLAIGILVYWVMGIMLRRTK
ncbi:MAG: amino acid permease [Dehalococcoidales bacterium]|nr:amino acid permease [Dehalococcoidales bacterium]